MPANRVSVTKSIAQTVDKQDLDALKRALRPAAKTGIPAAVMVKAGQLAWLPGLKLLVAAGGDLNASYRNYRALHALIQEEPHGVTDATAARVRCMEWMLAHGADPDLPSAWPSARALIIAAFQGQKDYVRVLRDHGGALDIFTASAMGDPGRVEKALAKNSSLAKARDHERLTALQCAAGSRMGKSDPRTADRLLECAHLLVNAGADVNASTPSWGHDVLVSYFVIRSGQIEMLKFLLSNGMDATAGVSTAAWDQREDALDLLISHGADVNRALDHDRPVLNELVRWGQFKQARLLLKKGADPNRPNDKGWTSMHQVVSRGNLKMLQDLVAAGGDANVADADGKTPRGMAKKSGRQDLLAAIDQRIV